MDYERIRQDASRRREALEKRRTEIEIQLSALGVEKHSIQREMAGLDEMLESIEFVTSPNIPPDFESLGLTQNIRAIYQGATFPLTPVEVRDLLLGSGVTGSSSKNLLISVHTIINREVERGDLKPVEKDGRPAHEWHGPRRFARTEAREAKHRAFIGQSLGASRSISRTSNEALAAQTTTSTPPLPESALSKISRIGDTGISSLIGKVAKQK